MKRVYELDVYKLAEELSDMVWHDFDKWNKRRSSICTGHGIRTRSLRQTSPTSSPNQPDN
ncbi:MAG: hypothetical protein JRG74_11345 [Deltaproteobacteria bacterium]|nr:hypothetical protein [Deltaproteobacteria bacterium]